MRKLITIILLFITSVSLAQTYSNTGTANLQRAPTAKGYIYRNNMSALGNVNWYTSAQIDSLINIAVGSGVISFNTRTGTVVSQESDYSAFFYDKTYTDSHYIPSNASFGLPLHYSPSTAFFSIDLATSLQGGYLSSTDWNTFNNKQTALGFTPENVANKVTSFTSPNNTTYPTTLAVQNGFIQNGTSPVNQNFNIGSGSGEIDGNLTMGGNAFSSVLNGSTQMSNAAFINNDGGVASQFASRYLKYYNPSHPNDPAFEIFKLTINSSAANEFSGNQPFLFDNLTTFTSGLFSNINGGAASEVVRNSDLTNTTLSSISTLQSYTGSANTILVTDSLRGGIFNKVVTTTYPVDNGIVFTASGGGFWVRDVSNANGVSVLWYGIKADWVLTSKSVTHTGTDQSTNIQNALNTAYKRSMALYFPAKYPYYYGSSVPIKVGQGTTILGDGGFFPYQSTHAGDTSNFVVPSGIYFYNHTDGIITDPSYTFRSQHNEFRHIGVIGSSRGLAVTDTTGGFALYSNSIGNPGLTTFDDVHVSGFSIGYKLMSANDVQSNLSTAENCRVGWRGGITSNRLSFGEIAFCDTAMILNGGQNQIQFNQFSANKTGVFIQAQNSNFNNNYFYQISAGDDITLGTLAFANHIESNYINNPFRYSIRIKSAQPGNKIMGNFVYNSPGVAIYASNTKDLDIVENSIILPTASTTLTAMEVDTCLNYRVYNNHTNDYAYNKELSATGSTQININSYDSYRLKGTTTDAKAYSMVNMGTSLQAPSYISTGTNFGSTNAGGWGGSGEQTTMRIQFQANETQSASAFGGIYQFSGRKNGTTSEVNFASLSGSALQLLTGSAFNLNGAITNSAYGTGILHASSSGLFSSSAVVVGDISATGTPSSTTFLRGDGSWSIAGTGTVTAVSSANTDIGVGTGTTTPVLTFNRGITGLTNYLPLTGGTLTGQLNIINNALSIQGPTTSDPSVFGSNTGIKVGTTAFLTHNYTSFNNGTTSIDDGVNLFVQTIPHANGTYALTNQIPTNADYVDRTTAQTIGGNKTYSNTGIFNGGLTANSVIINTGTNLSLNSSTGFQTSFTSGSPSANRLISPPDASGVIALTSQIPLAGSFSQTGTATTTFTVSIGTTMPNTNYKVPAPGASNLLSAAVCYITNKTPTTFDVVYLTGLTGIVSFDWVVIPQ